MLETTTRQRLLQEAVKLIGIDVVAVKLRTPQSLVNLRLWGLANMPDRKLLPLADLLDEIKRAK